MFKNELEKKELENKKHAALKAQKDRLYKTISIIVVSFMIIFSIVGLLAFLSKRKANKILENTNGILDNKNKELEKTTNIIDNDLKKASEYVYSLIPPPIDAINIKTNWRFIPSTRVGGDIFGYKWIDDENFLFFLLDSSGHGVSSALHSVSAFNMIKTGALRNIDYRKPGAVLSELNKYYQMTEHNNIYFTIYYCVYNTKTRLLSYSGAGHPPIIILDENKKSSIIMSENIFLGAIKDYEYKDGQIEIPPKSSIFLYSDGIYEVKKTDGEMWDFEDFSNTLVSLCSEDSSELDNLYETAITLSGMDILDDDFSILKVCID